MHLWRISQFSQFTKQRVGPQSLRAGDTLCLRHAESEMLVGCDPHGEVAGCLSQSVGTVRTMWEVEFPSRIKGGFVEVGVVRMILVVVVTCDG